jgi:hypothetical protein
MKYRIAMCVCAALLCASSAWAQDEEDAPPPKPVGAGTVTLYGLIDQGVEFVNNVANGKNKTTNGWRTGDGTATSYFLVKGCAVAAGKPRMFRATVEPGLDRCASSHLRR